MPRRCLMWPRRSRAAVIRFALFRSRRLLRTLSASHLERFPKVGQVGLVYCASASRRTAFDLPALYLTCKFQRKRPRPVSGDGSGKTATRLLSLGDIPQRDSSDCKTACRRPPKLNGSERYCTTRFAKSAKVKRSLDWNTPGTTMPTISRQTARSASERWSGGSPTPPAVGSFGLRRAGSRNAPLKARTAVGVRGLGIGYPGIRSATVRA